MAPKLLLADDSITVQRVIALTFAGEGIDVVTVGDGDEAVHRIVNDQPEIVLADVSMPGRDGYSVAEFVKRSAEHAFRTRVVLLTGAFEPVDESRTKALGVDGVLAKPFEPQMAIELVKRLLAQTPAQPSTDALDAAGESTRNSQQSRSAGQASGLGAGSGMAAGYPFEPRSESKDASAELDDYFRRLDEALATAGLATPSQAAGTGASASRANGEKAAAESADAEAQATSSQAEEQEEQTVMPSKELPTKAETPMSHDDTLILPAPADTAGQPSNSGRGALADAFATLLAVEQGEPGATPPSWTPASGAAGADSDALVEAVARRVIERMTDSVIREIVGARVLDVAERLVREEIERIKAHAGE
jgi:CheY-like chemotaxis protein